MSAQFVSATDDQWGPTRIITFSAGPYRRNVTLGQEGSALVFRLRTPLMGPNGRDFEIWLPRAVVPGELATVHIRFDHGSVQTTHDSDRRHWVRRHDFDVFSSGLLLRGTGDVTPLQMVSTRLMGSLILIIPLGVFCFVLLSARLRKSNFGPPRPKMTHRNDLADVDARTLRAEELNG